MIGWDFGAGDERCVVVIGGHASGKTLWARQLVDEYRERYPGATIMWHEASSKEPDKVWFDEVADFGSFDPRWNGVDCLAPVRCFTREELLDFFPSQTLTEPDMSTNNRAPQGRAVAGSKMGRRLNTSYYRGPTGRYADPHVSGEKELARGPRFYMEPNFPNGSPRSAPVLCIMSKKDFRDNVVYVES